MKVKGNKIASEAKCSEGERKRSRAKERKRGPLPAERKSSRETRRKENSDRIARKEYGSSSPEDCESSLEQW